MSSSTASSSSAAETWLSREELCHELAAAHVLLAEYGFTDTVWNHCSARLRPDSTDYLVTPFPYLFDEMTPALINRHGDASDNVTGHVIHGAVYGARADVAAVVHTHSEAIEAVSTLSDGVALLSQNGGGFFEGIAYHEWEGMSTDWEEQASIAADVAAHERTHTLLMRNHGACTFGASVGQAWVRMYYLDIICRVALNALSTGQPLRIPDEKTMAHASTQYDIPGFRHGDSEWGALRRQADRLMARYAAETARLAPFMPCDTSRVDDARAPARLAQRRYVVSSDAPNFPEVLTPADSDFPRVVDLSDAAESGAAPLAAHIRQAMDERLPTEGALVFRGCDRATADPQAFAELLAALSPSYLPRDYVAGAAARSSLAEGVMTASVSVALDSVVADTSRSVVGTVAQDDPASVSIEPHLEMSYSADPPDVVLFGCMSAPGPRQGGETPVADMRAFTAAIDPSVLDEFAERGVRYTRCLLSRKDADSAGITYSWQQSLGTEVPEEAERALEARGYEWEWAKVGGDTSARLLFHWTRPAVVPDTAARNPQGVLWANQATTLHHSYYLDYPDAATFARACPEPRFFPSDTAFGDGGEIDAELVADLRAALWRSSVAHAWQRGDVLALENRWVAHGRMGFDADASRRILVSLVNRAG